MVYIDSGLSLLASMWSGAAGKYRVVVNTESSSSWWNSEQLLVHLGGRMPSSVKGVKGKLWDRQVLEGLLIHELGHVRFTTDVRDQEKLKKAIELEKKGKFPGIRSVRDLLPCPWDIINVLEDRRIEARQMAEFGSREIKNLWEKTVSACGHTKAENLIFSHKGYKANFNVYNALIAFSIIRAGTVDFGQPYENSLRRMCFSDKKLLQFREDANEATDKAILATSTAEVAKISSDLYTKWKELFDFFDGYTPLPEMPEENEETEKKEISESVSSDQNSQTAKANDADTVEEKQKEESSSEDFEEVEEVEDSEEAEENAEGNCCQVNEEIKESDNGSEVKRILEALPENDPKAKGHEMPENLSPEKGGSKESLGKTEIPDEVQEAVTDDDFNKSKKKEIESSEESNIGKSKKSWGKTNVFEWNESLIRKESAAIKRYLTIGDKPGIKHGIIGKEVNTRKLSIPTLTLFKKKVEKPQGPKVPLVLVLDNSGSMQGFPQVCGAHVARILYESGVFPDMITLICSDAGVIEVKDYKGLQKNMVDGDESFHNLIKEDVLPYLANKIVLFLTDACTYGASADAIKKLAKKTKVIGGYVGNEGNHKEVLENGKALFPAFITSDSTEGIGLKLARFLNKAANRKSLYQYD